MGYFLQSCPDLVASRRPHSPEFEGPVKGFAPDGSKVLIFTTGQASKVPSGLPPVAFPPSVDTQLLNLRSLWLKGFLMMVEELNPSIPKDVAVEWVNWHFPKTADELRKSIMNQIPTLLAARLVDAWMTQS